MDKLLVLPTQHKILIVVGLLGAVAGGFYYLVMGDLGDQLVAARSKEQKAQKEYTALREFEQSQRQETVQAAREAEERKLEENKKMLPAEDEIPSFIMSIKADADAAGLEVLKFEPQEAEIEDYYKRIPIKVEVMGKAQDLVDFMTTLAAPKKRIVNLKQISFERLAIDIMKIRKETGQESDFDKAAKWKRMKKEERDMTNEEKRMLKLLRWQEANEMNQVRASFVAYTFSYTGEAMPEELRKKRQQRQRRRS